VLIQILPARMWQFQKLLQLLQNICSICWFLIERNLRLVRLKPTKIKIKNEIILGGNGKQLLLLIISFIHNYI
jgi:hypothetical protein